VTINYLIKVKGKMNIRSYPASADKIKGEANIRWEITNFRLIILTALFLVAFDNFAFFKNVTAIYPVSISNIGFLCSISVVLISVLVLLFSIFCFKYTTKPILITILLLASLASYFMNNYHIVIDETMIQNTIETDTSEVFDLLNIKLFIYLIFTGILPSIIIYKIKVKYKSFLRELFSRMIVVTSSLLILFAAAFPVSAFYTSFLREHKPLRYYTNPTYFIFSTGKYIAQNLRGGEKTIIPIGTDAKMRKTDTERELIILVVGEAVRANRLHMNGYERETTPLIEKEDIINFPEVYSCGTTTSISIPCMFSNLTRAGYSDNKAQSTYNILDVLSTAGVNILWRENNSSSKGVADRVTYEDFKNPDKNTVCNPECRDEGMLIGLQEYIESKKTGDILIVLHQMGNHGPAYYKRYPDAFKKFTPVCETSQLEECTSEEISNAYDNAVLYTDYFLSKVIGFLKQNPQFETAMFYIGDHGESLGENSVYLHGLPYFMAPENQKRIPAIMWFGDKFRINREKLREVAGEQYSQDNLFHTLLGLMEVETSVYDKDLDIINPATVNVTEAL
jgi:lipid A ethanolaminephosphotransferase